ncbi:MAG: magnesium transporter [Gammaproteobacteria bacterium]|nr:magnesium transporter [Gammaproteobacteria bacterium]
MSTDKDTAYRQRPERALADIIGILDKQDLLSTIDERQAEQPRHDLVKELVAKQNLVELDRVINRMHPADIAFVLEGLPLERREYLWTLVPDEQRGAVLIELSEPVRERMMGAMRSSDIATAVEQLDADEVADLVPHMPPDAVQELMDSLPVGDRSEVSELLRFPEGSVGALMEYEAVRVREDIDLATVFRYLRQRKELPEQLSEIFVVDRNNYLRGKLAVTDLLAHNPDTEVSELMHPQPLTFNTDDPAQDAVQAFERYDLVAAPVVNQYGQLVGVINIADILDYVSESIDDERLKHAGLSEEEDLFAPIWRRCRNRWAWLGLNLVLAVAASRVIGLFEHIIAQQLALATLLPVVANIAGNTGNQTVALIIRALALNQISTGSLKYMALKEVSIGLINGLIWGTVTGLAVLLFYSDIELAVVTMLAVALTLMIAALVGVYIPYGFVRGARDPVLGSSIIVTFMTDGLAFFVFLGLASVMLY